MSYILFNLLQTKCDGTFSIFDARINSLDCCPNPIGIVITGVRFFVCLYLHPMA